MDIENTTFIKMFMDRKWLEIDETAISSCLDGCGNMRIKCGIVIIPS